jgi:hypothetical protein
MKYSFAMNALAAQSRDLLQSPCSPRLWVTCLAYLITLVVEVVQHAFPGNP